jgi:DNA-binding transcriptional LysR family regulator
MASAQLDLLKIESALPMINLGRLQTFHEVMTRRSFSAAADALGYTQSSVSQQVSVLENELGATLVDRTARPVRPTPAGSVVLSHAEALLGQARAVEQELAALTSGESGTLRLGGFFTAWSTFLPHAVAAFARARPAVTLELRQLEPDLALRALRAGELDVAVVYRYGEIDPGREEWTKLLDDRYAVAVPEGHRLAKRKRIALTDLAGERWVSPPAGTPYSEVLRALCEEHGGFTPQIGFETVDIAMAQPLVASGLAVSLLPGLGLMPRHTGVAVLPLTMVPPARSVWAVRPGRRRSAVVSAIVDALGEAAAELDG